MSRNRRARELLPGGLPLPLCSKRREKKKPHRRQTNEKKTPEKSRAERGAHQADGRRRGRVETCTQRSHTVGCRRQTRRTGSGPDTAVSFQPPPFLLPRLGGASRRPACAVVPCPDPGTRLRQAACSSSHAPVDVTERFFSLSRRRDSALLASHTDSHFRVF